VTETTSPLDAGRVEHLADEPYRVVRLYWKAHPVTGIPPSLTVAVRTVRLGEFVPTRTALTAGAGANVKPSADVVADVPAGPVTVTSTRPPA
jgi:hypothetical protein